MDINILFQEYCETGKLKEAQEIYESNKNIIKYDNNKNIFMLNPFLSCIY